MTLWHFIKALKRVFPEAQYKAVDNLLKNAGANQQWWNIELERRKNTIKSWISRSKGNEPEIKIPYNSEDIFPDNVMDEHEFMDYIKRRIHEDVWKKVQEAFVNVVDDGDAVDVSTNDREVFCESLMRQFYLLFGLHRSGNYKFKVSTSESNAVAETESIPEPLQQDDDLEPNQTEIAHPQDDEGQESLSLDSEDNDSTASELLLSTTEPESELITSEVPGNETEEEGSSDPSYPCEDFINVIKKHSFDIDIFLKRKVKDIYEDEFRQIQPVMVAFLEILPKLQDTDNKPIYPYPSSVKQFIKAFREYYEYFQEHHLANLTIKDNTVYKIREDAPIIIESPVPFLSEHLHESLRSGDKLRKAAKKLYSSAKEDADYAVKRYHEMIE